MSNEIAEPEVITVQSGAAAAGSREISLSRWPTKRERERERARERRESEGKRRGWTEQGMTRKSFNMVYRRRVKERNVSESFSPRKFVTRSTCKNILSGTRQRGRPTFPSPSIDPSINISPPRNFHPLAPFDPAPAIDVTISRLIRSLFG